jgi:hypothetical protein
VAVRRLLAAAAATLGLAAPAHAATFKVSLKGEQVTSYSQTLQGSCSGTESGKQTIAIASTRPGKVKLIRLGHGRVRPLYGSGNIQTDWRFDRTFASACAPPPYDCGAQGPVPVQLNLSYRGGEFTLSGVANGVGGKGPSYRTCNYEGYHETDLQDALGRISARKLLHTRKPFHLVLKAHRNETLADTNGKQTTDVHIDATLRRVR